MDFATSCKKVSLFCTILFPNSILMTFATAGGSADMSNPSCTVPRCFLLAARNDSPEIRTQTPKH